MTDLKPCPFCGGDARTYQDTTSDYERHWTWSVECVKCECEAGHCSRTEDDAITAWNTRAAVPVEALERLIEDCDFTSGDDPSDAMKDEILSDLMKLIDQARGGCDER